MNEMLAPPLRPAIKSLSAPASPLNEEPHTKLAGRRVNFPEDETLVTGYLEPPDPWEKAMNSTTDEVISAYRTACEKQQIKPLNNLLQQLQMMSIGEREDCLSLKGEKLDLKQFEAMEEIFKRIQFTTIDVESTNLDDEGSVALFDMIEYYESAKSLNISSNKSMTSRGWQACARMLKKTQCLESLSAQNTSLNEQFMSLLCRTLRCSSSLTKLHLENCSVTGRTCTLLMTALKLNSTLKELYLAENKLSPLDALQIGNLFRANSTLEILDLRNNCIQDTGVAHIVDGLNDQALGSNCGLRFLNLTANQLTYHSGNHLAKSVANSRSLKVLKLSNNNITNEGVFHLKEGLMKNRTLQQLALEATRITCEGAVALAECIADNPCLIQLNLFENNIKLAGLMALSLSMKVNLSISRLDLDKDYKKESGKELQEQHQHLLLDIMESCERNRQLHEVKQKEEKLKEIHKVEEPNEKLSDSVTRLLSLWDHSPSTNYVPIVTNKKNKINPESKLRNENIKAKFLQNNVNSRQSIIPSPTSLFQSKPVIVLPGGEAVCDSTAPRDIRKGTTFSVNSLLLSPPSVHQSPPKSRFQVSRVHLDSDVVLSSAGNTPMPSPVPSPGHTPMPSPGCTPLASPGSTPSSSPVPSPVGSPVSSPCRSLSAHGVVAPPPSPIKYRKGLPKTNLLLRDGKRNIDNNRPFSSRFILDDNVAQVPAPLNAGGSLKNNDSSFLLTVDSTNTGNYAPPSSPASSFEEELPIAKPSFTSHKTANVNSVIFSSPQSKCVDYRPSSELSYPKMGVEAPPNTPAPSSVDGAGNCFEFSEEESYTEETPSLPENKIRFESTQVSGKSPLWAESLSENDSLYHNSGSSYSSCVSDSGQPLSLGDSKCMSVTPQILSSPNCSLNDWSVPRADRTNSEDFSSVEHSPMISSPSTYDIWKNELHQDFASQTENLSSNASLTRTCSSSYTELDSLASADSGLATPDSESSGCQSTISFSSRSENGELACSLECINHNLADSCKPGSLAPPPTPVDYDNLTSNSVINYCTAALGKVVVGDISLSATESLNKPVVELHVTVLGNDTSILEHSKPPTCKETPTLDNSECDSNPKVSCFTEENLTSDMSKKILEHSDQLFAQTRDEVTEYHGLKVDGHTRSLSDSVLDSNKGESKKKMDIYDNDMIPSKILKKKLDSLPDVHLINSNTTIRYHPIKLAEPSCVRLFGGGVPANTTMKMYTDKASESSTEDNNTQIPPNTSDSSVYDSNESNQSSTSNVENIRSQAGLNSKLTNKFVVMADLSSSSSVYPFEIKPITEVSNVCPPTEMQMHPVKDEVSTSDQHDSESTELKSKIDNKNNLEQLSYRTIPDSKYDRNNINNTLEFSSENDSVKHDETEVYSTLGDNCPNAEKATTPKVQSSHKTSNPICRRASTGSFPGAKNGTCKRRISMTVDELIQKQLIELYNSSKKNNFVDQNSSWLHDENNIVPENSTIEGLSMSVTTSPLNENTKDNSSDLYSKSDFQVNECQTVEPENSDNVYATKKLAQTFNIHEDNSSLTNFNLLIFPPQNDCGSLIRDKTQLDMVTQDSENGVFLQSRRSEEKCIDDQQIVEENLVATCLTVQQEGLLECDIIVDRTVHEKSTMINADVKDDLLPIDLNRHNHPESASDSEICNKLQLACEVHSVPQNNENDCEIEDLVETTNANKTIASVDTDNSCESFPASVTNIESAALVLNANVDVSNDDFIENLHAVDLHCNITSNVHVNSAAGGFSLNVCILEDADSSFPNYSTGIPNANQDPISPESLKI